ncbi:PaaI family thioesterase [Nocardioides sp. YIM 152588]|uniref:PaaI family thioesterase n=1 Tax=Nocardioides sp. YIM 152588 TaxID=3158259 RepID=UPI0032E4A959
MSGLSLGSFVASSLSTAEVEAAERLYGGLADDVRRLVDVVIRTEVDAGRVEEARALVRRAEELLAEEAKAGPAGIHFNHEGRSWNWGNAVVGVRNAVAPPLRLARGEDGVVRTDAELGAAYEGPPGCVHGGVSALMLDHLMGETASAGHTRMTVTGTLTLRYATPLPLGPVWLRAWIEEEAGRKITVLAQIGPGDPEAGAAPAIEAQGLFIVPRWAQGDAAPPGVGSLD